MRARFPLIAISAVLALAACSKSPEQPAAEPSSSEAAEATRPSPTSSAEASEAASPPGSSSGTAAPTSSPSAALDEASVVADEIPVAIRGRWGLVPKDCTSKLGDAKGLLTVSANQLKFYEAVAKLGKVKDAGEDSLRGTFAFSGEGQAWTLDVALAVENGGKTLIRRDAGKDALPGPLKYTRCA